MSQIAWADVQDAAKGARAVGLSLSSDSWYSTAQSRAGWAILSNMPLTKLAEAHEVVLRLSSRSVALAAPYRQKAKKESPPVSVGAHAAQGCAVAVARECS